MEGIACQGELDELEREEFFRLKKVQGKKHNDAKARSSPTVGINQTSAGIYLVLTMWWSHQSRCHHQLSCVVYHIYIYSTCGLVVGRSRFPRGGIYF